MERDVTDEQRSRRPVFNATLRAAGGWLFFRVARSTRMNPDMRLRSRLGKQPTDLRRHHHYMPDGSLMNREMIICVPGPWEDRADFARHVFVLEPRGRYTFAGGVLADVQHQDHIQVRFLGRHPRMLDAFEAATRGDLPIDVSSEISGHRSSIYLRFPSNVIEERLRILKFTELLKRLGGIAIKLESSGVGHWWERWFQLLGSKNEFDWYCAVVMLLAADSRYYSCGMHHFGLADSAVEKHLLIREAANLINKFNYWRIINQRTLHSGELLRIDESGARFRLLWEPDRMNPEGDLFHNPHGIWLLQKD